MSRLVSIVNSVINVSQKEEGPRMGLLHDYTTSNIAKVRLKLYSIHTSVFGVTL